jgi:diguanylate cyclase (GGDEF)-like protein/PAS domain S-box-containing protein
MVASMPFDSSFRTESPWPAAALARCPYPAALLRGGRAVGGNAEGFALAAAATPLLAEALLGLPTQRRLDHLGRSYDLTVLPLPDGALLLTGREVTFETQILNALTRSRALFRDLVLCSTDFAWEVDGAGRFDFVSPRGALGYAAEELVGRPVALLAAHPGAADLFRSTEPQHLAEVRLTAKDGTTRICQVSSVPVLDATNRPAGARGVVHDVSEVRARDAALADANKQLERLSRTDELTGLLNRRALVAELEARLGRLVAGGPGGALLYCDLDNFKAVNDTLGHPAGDACLAAFAAMLEQSSRRGDMAARLGGDEFALWLDGAPETAAQRKAALLRAGLSGAEAAWSVADQPLGVSTGIAVAQPGDTAEGLLARADAAMYVVKRTGRRPVRAEAAA